MYLLLFICLLQAIKMSESLIKRTPLPDDIQVPLSNVTQSLTEEEEAFRRVGSK